TRARSKNRIIKHGGKNVLTLCDILNAPVNGSGCNPEYGLLGSNKATEDTVKLFPKNAQEVAEGIRDEVLRRTGVHVEAMVYGDGAFKDPVGKIWELADPVVSPGYTEGLLGLPNELKLKFLADNDYADLSGEELAEKIRGRIREKDRDLKGSMLSQGTTPRMLTDLIGSLCDLTSGSGDKGTPIVLVQDYFVNYAD
ncbi:MAG: coenzyme F420-0:L-glutamate ligase, partial [Clostridia bacterium]|nr:coenzyme F420-0:L-glutamate ligase [Clostridia bacterium]